MTQPMSDEDWRVFDILCGQKVNGHDYIIRLITRVVVFYMHCSAAERDMMIL